MTTPNYDDILIALDRQAFALERQASVAASRGDYSAEFSEADARLLREAFEIVKKHEIIMEDARDRPI